MPICGHCGFSPWTPGHECDPVARELHRERREKRLGRSISRQDAAVYLKAREQAEAQRVEKEESDD